MSEQQGDAVSAFTAGVLERARREARRKLPPGTSIVAEDERSGTSSAVVYPLGDRTVVFCDRAVEQALAPVVGLTALSTDAFVDMAVELGASEAGRGNNRVLDGPVASADQPLPGGASVRSLDRSVAADVALVSTFIDACDPDDLDEVELYVDELDPRIVGLIDPATDAVIAYASGRVWDRGEEFDDIGVIVHPDHRRRGLGVSVVRAYINSDIAAGRRFLYRNDVDNIGSDAVAQALGFTLVHTIAAVTFDGER